MTAIVTVGPGDSHSFPVRIRVVGAPGSVRGRTISGLNLTEEEARALYSALNIAGYGEEK